MKTNKLILFFLFSGILILITACKPKREMLISTGSADNITQVSVDLHGKILDRGDGVTQHGHCWATTPNTSISSNKTELMNPTGDDFTSQVTNLTPNTKYYYRAYCSDGNVTVYGSELNFTTISCTAPSATTDGFTAVGSTTVALNGTVDANSSSTTVTFDYGPTTSYGSSITASQNPVTGDGNTSVSAGVTGLTSGTIYHFRVKAVNCGGTTNGNDLTFTTSCLPPTMITEIASNVGTQTATLNGTVNASNSSTTVTFDYGITTSYGSTVTASPSPVTGNSNTVVSAGIGGLTPNTIYHFRVKGTNCGGTNNGSDQTFTTICSVATAITNAPSSVGSSTAILNGSVNANNSTTIVTFEYGTTTGYGITAAAAQSPITGNISTAVSADITGLSPGTVYHYRVKAVNCGGTVYGNDQTFAASCTAPTASSNVATNIGTSFATLNGTVNGNNSSTTVTFDYGTTMSYGSSITATQSPVTGSINTAASAGLTLLNPNTLYHFRIKAINCEGTSVYGNDLQFTTLCTAPTATTNSATSIGNTTATLNGVVNPNNFSTTVTFEYGLTTSYGSTITAAQSPVGGGSNTTVSAGLTLLNSNTTYHFRVKAANCGGTISGSDQQFITKLCPGTLTVTHTAGNIAPVTKTVTYGIVETSLSGANKCWTTQNLGATNQAASVTDATEAAAGWYWQFNRKQGFKHDGITRTPATSWIYPINEASDWTQANDPCTILLGTGWRLPTYTEWSNAVIGSGWHNYNDTFASVLKLHAAGDLNTSTGSLESRGLNGINWSSSQASSSSLCWYIYFSSSYLNINSNDKSWGASIRCIKD